MAKKALLMILDGWGIGKHDKGDVIFKTPTPYLDYLTAVSAHSTLQTCGEDVGLPKGQMGNSEVGRLNIGAGRVVYQDLVKINKACESGDILKNQEIINAYSYPLNAAISGKWATTQFSSDMAAVLYISSAK